MYSQLLKYVWKHTYTQKFILACHRNQTYYLQACIYVCHVSFKKL